jgi:hypothetical protein
MPSASMRQEAIYCSIEIEEIVAFIKRVSGKMPQFNWMESQTSMG